MQYKQQQDWTLASGSPRRAEYLYRYGFRFSVVPPDILEVALKKESPSDFVKRMAVEKSKCIAKQVGNDNLVIAADTIVVDDQTIIGKPKDPEESFSVLKRLNGREHYVLSAFHVINLLTSESCTEICRTKVCFLNMPESVLRNYACSDEPSDKAGSYSIQGLGACLIASIEGSYNNVVGFPIEIFLLRMLEKGFIEV